MFELNIFLYWSFISSYPYSVWYAVSDPSLFAFFVAIRFSREKYYIYDLPSTKRSIDKVAVTTYNASPNSVVYAEATRKRNLPIMMWYLFYVMTFCHIGAPYITTPCLALHNTALLQSLVPPMLDPVLLGSEMFPNDFFVIYPVCLPKHQ